MKDRGSQPSPFLEKAYKVRRVHGALNHNLQISFSFFTITFLNESASMTVSLLGRENTREW